MPPLLLPLLAVGLASAYGEPPCPNTVEAQATLDTPEGAHYVWMQPCEGCVSWWIHQESNGTFDLQDGGEWADPCPADRLVL